MAIGGGAGLLAATRLAGAFGYTTRPELGEPIARVVERVGKTNATHPALERSIDVGNLIFEQDVITTNETGYLRLAMLSGDELRIGPMAHVTISKVIGEVRMPRGIHISIEGTGAVRFLPRIDKPDYHPPMQVSLKTPAGTASGVDADFWAGWLDRSYMIYLTKGALDVTSLAGQQDMRNPGEAIKLRDLNAEPPRPFLVRDRQLEKMETKIRRPTVSYY